MIDFIEALGLFMCVMGGTAWVYFQYQTITKKEE